VIDPQVQRTAEEQVFATMLDFPTDPKAETASVYQR
jgi:hypothetical protein